MKPVIRLLHITDNDCSWIVLHQLGQTPTKVGFLYDDEGSGKNLLDVAAKTAVALNPAAQVLTGTADAASVFEEYGNPDDGFEVAGQHYDTEGDVLDADIKLPSSKLLALFGDALQPFQPAGD